MIIIDNLVGGLGKGGLDRRTIIIPVARATAGVDRGRRGNGTATDETVFSGFFLDDPEFGCFRADGALGGFAGFVACTELVEAQRTGAQMSTLVETALITHDFTGIKCGTTPGRWFSGMAVEAPATEILSLLGRRVIGMLDRKTCVGGKVGHCHTVVQGRRGRSTVKRGLGGNHDRVVLKLDRRTIVKLSVRLMGRSGHGGNKRIATVGRGGVGSEGDWFPIYMV
jgi:hypothetical protein